MQIDVGREYAVKRYLPRWYVNHEFILRGTSSIIHKIPLMSGIVVGRVYKQISKEEYIVRIRACRNSFGDYDEFAVHAKELAGIEETIKLIVDNPDQIKDDVEEEDTDDDVD